MEKLVALIPLFPTLGFLFITFFGKNLNKNTVGGIATAMIAISFGLAAVVFSTQLHATDSAIVKVLDWIHVGSFHVDISFIVDPLSSLYILFITGVGSLIHLYSIGYMHEDEGFNRFMSYLNLFVFFMLLLVLGDNLLMLFVGWEGVGVCSFMLIGFWYKDHANNDAAKKAFVINRVGDLGLLLAMTLIFIQCGSLNYNDLMVGGSGLASLGSMTTMVGILLFIGAMGKSAQFPLHTWLPDAMAGPTPVSALIHAATMVTAGIYLVARFSDLYAMSEVASQVITWAGVITAIMGASIALTQNDIKKVLAYSTVSQLGFMFAALGMGAYSIAVFHVVTHAFFKALLFLGSGSVIHAMGGEQDIRRMGGLKKHMPITYWTFLIGTIAIAGIFPFAGFFSKDQILAHAMENNTLVFALLMLAAAGTAFYMFRMFYLTFHGEFRGTHEQEHHLHESPATMTTPLIILAIASTVGGFIGFPHAIGESLHLHHWLDHFLAGTVVAAHSHLDATAEIALALISMAIAAGMIYYAYNLYIQKGTAPLEDNEISGGMHRLLWKKYGFDELYDNLFRKPIDAIASGLHHWVEDKALMNIVDGTGQSAKGMGKLFQFLHNGQI
ncbi:MAG: NADH-quinone oxidoreductase subunit L, partial [Bacteroidetes bacterium]|nr:NADH-quinone oxidoreductase subunit L [Bacteroidota bacterium]